MSWIDLLRMSLSNLKRRKLRTFLTVLGVIIGTASIVVMISLGLGLKQSLYVEMEQSGGLTTLTVSGKSAGESMYYTLDRSGTSDNEKYVDDDLLKKLKGVEHVVTVSPVYEMNVILLKGNYIGNCMIYATNREGLEARNMSLKAGGNLPTVGGNNLQVVYGNMVLQNFSDKSSGKGYWETGEIPDINFEKDSLFLIFDTDAYYNQQASGGLGNISAGGSGGSGSSGSSDSAGGLGGIESSEVSKSLKKNIVTASGVIEGGIDDYNANAYQVFCDLDTLKQILKKEFSGRVIPGQPATKSGKPYKEFYYSSAKVKVDNLDSADIVAEQIRQMGYNVESNIEYMESMQKEFAIVEAVLGGIGAVSLLVAAIGIANTMMMSIYERTKEIGIIKVLGCSLKNIRQMFLIEAAAIGFLGGLIGNIISFIMSAIINILTAGKDIGVAGVGISYIPFWLVLASMGFAMFVGIAAGYFPALRAMKLSPLAAIRSE